MHNHLLRYLLYAYPLAKLYTYAKQTYVLMYVGNLKKLGLPGFTISLHQHELAGQADPCCYLWL